MRSEHSASRTAHALMGCAAALLLTCAAQAEELVEFKIPPQSLETALLAFADQTGAQVATSSESIAALQTKGVSGRLTPRLALARLIEGNDLEIRSEGEHSYSLLARSAPTGAQPQDRTQSQGKETSQRDTAPNMEDRKKKENRSNENSEANDLDSGGSERIETVLVTAQKRQERLSDVPISIAVLSSEEINQRGLVNGSDYLRGLPNVNQVEGYQGQAIVIRGIESSPASQNFSAGATVATYFGETPTTSAEGLSGGASPDLKIVDVQRVEVLRGPQGTAFGSSSMGGTVRIIPTAPNLQRFEGRSSLSVSNTSGAGSENYSVEAVANIPIVKEKVAVRATAYLLDDSGFYRNTAGSNPVYQAGPVTRYGAQANAVDRDDIGASQVKGGRLSALLQATDKLRFSIAYLAQRSEMDGVPLATVGSYEQALPQVAPEHVARGETGGVYDVHVDLLNATMEYDLTWADLLATYSHIKGGTLKIATLDYLGIDWAQSGNGDSEVSEDIAELRIATRLSGSWNALAGLYSEEIKDDAVFTYYWFGDPAKDVLPPADRFNGDYIDKRSLEQRAAFGEVSWAFAPGATLTAGARRYDYERAVRVDTHGAYFGTRSSNNVGDAAGTTYRANLSYKPTESSLVYAGWSQGFRLGKPQPGLAPGLCDVNGDGLVDGTNDTIESTRIVHSDEVDSYEVGTKFALFEQRMAVTLALFRMEWSGIPVRVLAPPAPIGCASTYVANANDARSTGVELDTLFRVTDPLRVRISGSWTNAELTEDSLGAPKGNQLPGSPELTVNLGLQYATSVFGYGTLLRIDSAYVGSFYGNLAQSPNTKAGDYTKVDAAARLTVDDLDFDLFVNNLTNEDAFVFRGTAGNVGPYFGYQLRPRTVGLRMSYKF